MYVHGWSVIGHITESSAHQHHAVDEARPGIPIVDVVGRLAILWARLGAALGCPSHQHAGMDYATGATRVLARAARLLSLHFRWPRLVHVHALAAVVAAAVLGLRRYSVATALFPIVLMMALGWYSLYRAAVISAAKREALEARLAYDHDFLHRVLASVPTWVTFSDKEQCRWLQAVLFRMWPSVSEALEKEIRAYLTPELLDSVRPPFLQQLRLAEFRLGRQAPKVTGVNVRTRQDALVVDLDIRLSTTSEIGLSAKTSLVSLPLRLSDFTLTGTLRLIMSPLGDDAPFFKAISLTFIGRPEMQYDLNAVRLPLSSIPGRLSYCAALAIPAIPAVLARLPISIRPLSHLSHCHLLNAGPPGRRHCGVYQQPCGEHRLPTLDVPQEADRSCAGHVRG